MPNWSCNRLYVKGHPKKVKEFTDTLGTPDTEGKECDFSFSQTVPMPEALLCTAGSQGELGYAMITNKVVNPFGDLDEYKERFNNLSSADQEACLEEGRTYKYNMEHYGAVNWYEWRIAHWGTKWDASDVDIDVDAIKEVVDANISTDSEEVTIDIGFDTAWSPPIDWLKKVAKKFPELEFKIAFSECGMSFYGTATIIGDDYEEEISEQGCTFEGIGEPDEDGEYYDYEPSGDWADFLEYHHVGQGG